MSYIIIESFEIITVTDDKRRYMSLLLVGDESEAMIDRYLDHGSLYVGMSDGRPIAVCATVLIDEDTVEVKNLAVDADFRRLGIGRRMLAYVEELNRGKAVTLGTGETPSTLSFYECCGYSYSHRVVGFFTDNYPAPIIEDGVTLKDMIYLVKTADPMPNRKIVRCGIGDYEALAGVWERSVRATHNFLDKEVFDEIKAALIPDYFPGVDLYAIVADASISGFIGLNADMIEMLFIDSDSRGCGLGTLLVDFAKRRGATKVDVNEQNPSALRFYLANGFRIIGRDETDDAGRPYPILHLSL